MNDKMQEALTALIEKALNGIDAAGDFMAGEIPEVINQLLMWHGVTSFLTMVMSILIFVATYISSVRLWPRLRADNTEPFIVFMFIPGMIACINFSTDWLKIIIAPKLYLLEYAAAIVR